MVGRAITDAIEDISGLLGDARKIVFVIIALSVVAFTAMGKLSSEQYMTVASMVFTYFFATKDEGKDNIVG